MLAGGENEKTAMVAVSRERCLRRRAVGADIIDCRSHLRWWACTTSSRAVLPAVSRSGTLRACLDDSATRNGPRSTGLEPFESFVLHPSAVRRAVLDRGGAPHSG